MDFSLFDEASRNHDDEALQRRTALVRTAVQEEIFPFLALATTEEDYRHRKALAYDRLLEIANRHEASLDETEMITDRMYGLLVEAKTKHYEASLSTRASMKCANCSHGAVSTDHAEGLKCSTCGCSSFKPQVRTASVDKEARRVTAENGDGEGPFS